MYESFLTEPLKQLRTKREELKKEQGQLVSDLSRLDRAIVELETIASRSPRTKSKTTARIVESQGIIGAREISGLSLAQSLKLLLARSSSPLTIRQMLPILKQAGRKQTKNAYRIVYKTLRGDNAFQSLKGAWGIARVDQGAPQNTLPVQGDVPVALEN